MADKTEEMTLDAYAKQAKSTEKGTKKNNVNGGKKRLDKKLNGVKSAIRRTGRGNDNNNRSAGKPRQNSNKNGSFNNNNGFNKNSKNSNYSSNNQRNSSSSRPPLSENRAPKTKVVRPIPEHKKRIVKVYNLVPSINNEEFYNLFVKYGSIEQSKIETDKKGKSEEKGFVVYRDNDAAKRAIEDLNGVELEGRIITVEFMKDGEKLGERPSTSGSSGSGDKSERGSDRGDRDRRSSDAPHGIQKRIFKNKEDRFERRDNRNSGGNRRDNNNRRDYDRNNNRRNNNYGSSNNGNRNRSHNGGSSRNNNRKFSR